MDLGQKQTSDIVNIIEAAHNEWMGLRFLTKGRVETIQNLMLLNVLAL